MKTPLFRTGYDFAFGPRGDIDFGDEPSLTIQSAKDECDINLILDKASKGIMPAFNSSTPTFADVSNVADYQSALHLIQDAQDRFDSLPAAIRDRFANDPAQLLEFVGDPGNKAEAIKLGLIDAPTPAPASAAPSPSATGDAAPSGAASPVKAP